MCTVVNVRVTEMFQFTQISTHFKLKGGLKSIVAVTVAVGVIMTKSLTYLESGDEKMNLSFPTF